MDLVRLTVGVRLYQQDLKLQANANMLLVIYRDDCMIDERITIVEDGFPSNLRSLTTCGIISATGKQITNGCPTCTNNFHVKIA